MTLIIELTPEQEARLAEAAQKEGIAPTTWAQKLVAEHLPLATQTMTPDARNQALIALLQSWREEDATGDEQELERRDIENEELMRNLQANRLSLRIPEV